MAARRLSSAQPVHTTGTEPGQSQKLINASRQNSAVVPIVKDRSILDYDDEAAKQELKCETERRHLFQSVSNATLDIPNGYRKVEVLIIRWDESIDEFKGHKQEIERLKTVFETGFNFGCTVASIQNRMHPQIDLDHHILSHVRKHDEDDNLLIVYYTGHGRRVEDGKSIRLQLSASQHWNKNSGGSHSPSAFWDEAERPLKAYARGDVLAILDCCSASTAAITTKGRNEGLRTYQMLAASSADEYTKGPGEASFTHALCDSLEELLAETKSEPFSVMALGERINSKRTTQAALMWDRLQRYKYNLVLGPLDSNPARAASFRREEREHSSLVLRFSLKTDEIDESQVDTLARQLPGVFKEAGIPARRMEWVEFERRGDSTKTIRRAVDRFRTPLTKRQSSPDELPGQSHSPESRKRRSSWEDSLQAPDQDIRGYSSSSLDTTSESYRSPRKSPRRQ